LPGSPIGSPSGSDSLFVSDRLFPGILPLIHNLQFGYFHSFGKRVASSRFTADYLLPIGIGNDSVVFGEAHTEFQGFWKTNAYNNRTDVSLGGGYRTILTDRALVGVNGFYDTTRLGDRWYASGGIGLELAALLPGNDALDLNFNWYARPYDGNVIRNIFRYGPGNFDVEAGYSHELWEEGPDLRLKLAGYKFDNSVQISGWNTGAEIKSRDGVFSLKYEVGSDKIAQTYHTVGASVNVGFILENILEGKSPFQLPEPLFKSPRNLRRLFTRNVIRNYVSAMSSLTTASARELGVGAGVLTYAAILPGHYGAYYTATYFFNVSPSTPPPGTPTQLSFTLHWTQATSEPYGQLFVAFPAPYPGDVLSYGPVPITIIPGDGSVSGVLHFSGVRPVSVDDATMHIILNDPNVTPAFGPGGSMTLILTPQ
jgi:hypothetical protein